MDAVKIALGLAQQALSSTNQPVASSANFSRAAPVHSGEGTVHLLIFALDYKRTNNSLTCSMDGKNMQALAKACGIADVVAMYDEQCTKENALRAISEVGSRCESEDYFIIYYSGHGTSVDDEDGDEDDGKDEAFCFVDTAGQITGDSLLIDDDFADAVINATEEDVRIIVLTDCCHSGTIADLDRDQWEDREVISIAGCMDSETSGDMGRGGIFTHAMLLAIDQLQDSGTGEYSVGMMYNATLDNDNKVFNSAQNITIQSSKAVTPDTMAWPLIPSMDYKAPLTQASVQAGGDGTAQGAIQMALQNPQLLAQLGIKPELVQFINAAGLQNGKIDPEALIKAGLTCYMAGGCKKENCAIQ